MSEDATAAGTPPGTVLLDIEGTVAPIRFVHQVLFPFARERLGHFVNERNDEPAVRAVLERVPGADRLATLRGWMDADSKVEPLKTLQGLIWEEGFRDGALRSELYPDVAPALRRWHAAGIRLAVYSSGSVTAQRLIFGHTEHGDLAPLFSDFFDTGVGTKRDAASYRAIATALDSEPDDILFLSDNAAELDAAREAGLLATQIVRAADNTVAAADHPTAPDLDALPDLPGAP